MVPGAMTSNDRWGGVGERFKRRGVGLCARGASSASPLGVVVSRSPTACAFLLHLAAPLMCAIVSAPHAEEPGSLQLPKLKTSGPTARLYPPAARRRHEEGRVLVEFAISPKGRVIDPPAVTLAEPEDGTLRLQEAALSYVRQVEFDIPSNWAESGGPRRKFHFSFVFLIRPCQEAEPCVEPAPYFGADRWFTIAAPPSDVSGVQPMPRSIAPHDSR